MGGQAGSDESFKIETYVVHFNTKHTNAHFSVPPPLQPSLQFSQPFLILQQCSSSSSVQRGPASLCSHLCIHGVHILLSFITGGRRGIRVFRRKQPLVGSMHLSWESSEGRWGDGEGFPGSSPLSPPEQVWELTEGFSGPPPRTTSGGQSLLCGLGDHLYCFPEAVSSRNNGNYFSFCIKPGPRSCATGRERVINQFTREEALVYLIL